MNVLVDDTNLHRARFLREGIDSIIPFLTRARLLEVLRVPEFLGSFFSKPTAIRTTHQQKVVVH